MKFTFSKKILYLIFLGVFILWIRQPINVKAQPSTLPTDWILLDVDGAESGCVDHRDVVNASYSFDSTYLYLNLEMVSDAGWPGTTGSTTEARYKWWIETVGGDAAIYGTSVYNAEYLLMLEDLTNSTDAQIRDRLGELTFMDDLTHIGFKTRWATPATFPYGYVTNSPGSPFWRRVFGAGNPGIGGPQSNMYSPDIGYLLNGTSVIMYLNLSLIGNPGQICLIYATDINNANLDQAPNCDKPEEVMCTGSLKISEIGVEKKLIGPGDARVGDFVIFQINVTNLGETSYKTINLVDVYDPSVLQYVSADIPPDHSYISGPNMAVLEWDNLTGPPPNGVNVTLDPGKFISLNITYHAVNWTEPGDTVNFINVTKAIDVFGNYNSANSSASLLVTIPPPDIVVEKELIQPFDGVADIGEAIVFNITISNSGSTRIKRLNITDLYNQSVLIYNDSSLLPNASIPGLLRWFYQKGLDIGETLEISLSFIADGTTYPNTLNKVNATARDIYNRTDTETSFESVIINNSLPVLPDVSLSKTHIWPVSPMMGDQVVFRINITNNGSTVLTNISLIDYYDPTCLQFLFSDIAPDHYQNHSLNSSSISWDDLLQVPPLGLNASLVPGARILFNVTYLALNYTGIGGTNNTVQVLAAFDASGFSVIDPPWDSVNVFIAPSEPDISVDKNTSILYPTVKIGDTVNYTIIVTNTGPQVLKQINITDEYDPEFLLFIGSSVDPTNQSTRTLFWRDILGGVTLVPGEDFYLNVSFLTIKPTVNISGVFDTINHVNVSAQDTIIVRDVDWTGIVINSPIDPPCNVFVGGYLTDIAPYDSVLSMMCLGLPLI